MFSKGYVPWNKGKKCPELGVGRLGKPSWNKGIPMTESTRALQSSIAKGRVSGAKGKRWSIESIERIRIIRKAQVNRAGPKGQPWSESRRKAEELRVKVPKVKVKPVIKNGKPYSPIWHDLRKLIYRRDNYTCQECGAHCHNKVGIACHHIDYDTLNNDLLNLITLCTSCHAKTNFRRENWIIHYREKMKAS